MSGEVELLQNKLKTLEEEIKLVRKQIKEAKERQRIEALPGKIEYEISKMKPGNFEWFLHGLVDIDETFEEFYSRHCAYAHGANCRDEQKNPGQWKETCFEYYQKGGPSAEHYLCKWMCEVSDERILSKQIFDNYLHTLDKSIALAKVMAIKEKYYA